MDYLTNPKPSPKHFNQKKKKTYNDAQHLKVNSFELTQGKTAESDLHRRSMLLSSSCVGHNKLKSNTIQHSYILQVIQCVYSVFLKIRPKMK